MILIYLNEHQHLSIILADSTSLKLKFINHKKNEIVYFVAGVGIVHNHVEHKQKFFLGHDDDIIR